MLCSIGVGEGKATSDAGESVGEVNIKSRPEADASNSPKQLEPRPAT